MFVLSNSLASKKSADSLAMSCYSDKAARPGRIQRRKC
jgi:hypothetical protein